MRSILLFFGVWGGYLGFSGLFFGVTIWAVSISDDALNKQATADLFRAVFWPLIWLKLRLTGKDIGNQQVPRALAAHSGSPTRGFPVPAKRTFRTIREAIDYLASRIAEEAKRQGKPLTEIERKMFHFTERGWTLPDMKAVNAEFDLSYDQDQYEQRIAGLVSEIGTRNNAQDPDATELWNQAVEKLSSGDRYILVLLGRGQSHKSIGNWSRHSLKVVAAVLIMAAFTALDVWIRHWMRDH